MRAATVGENYRSGALFKNPMKTISQQRDEIEEKLRDAINSDDYAEAARLRDELQRLGYSWIRSPRRARKIKSL